MSKLRLDWNLDTPEERLQYIQNLDLSQYSNDDLEKISNYILWSVEHNTEEKFHIKRSKNDWVEKDDKTESLEGLIETPGFTEESLHPLSDPPQKIRREVFSREEALNNCPDWLRPQYIQLFLDIDKTDYIVTKYELNHGKRTKPIREELIERLGASLRDSLDREAQELSQYSYLKKKHMLVSLRSQQYTLRDSYSSVIYRHTSPGAQVFSNEPNYQILPVGLYEENSIIFSEDLCEKARTRAINDKDLNKILHQYWDNINNPSLLNFDFRRLEDVYQLFLGFYEIEDEGEKRKERFSFDTQLLQLLQTLEYYTKRADLTEAQREILEMKKNKQLNQKIAEEINLRYGTSYTTNYISTIFRQKIIKKINEAAEHHARIIENLCFPENWKKCRLCGETLLLDADFFVRRARSRDGFASQCKRCDRKLRARRK